MSQPAENRTLDSFIRVATWYFANPPSTWCIARRSSGWYVTAPDGTYISSHRSRREAAANLTEGPWATDHFATLDWYLGYSRDPHLPALTDDERKAVAQVLSSIGAATPIRGSKRGGLHVENQIR
jgi:hypothetical protein